MTEQLLQFGEGGRLLGVLTQPGEAAEHHRDLPIFVFLSAGLLHRVGPYRLHVRLGRALAQMGFNSLRIDLAGTGDSPPRPSLTNQQSVAADFAEIITLLDSRLGQRPIVLAGLCSGADNAMILALKEPRVVGMVLLDPICFPDQGLLGFEVRRRIAKYTKYMKYLNPLRLITRLSQGMPAAWRARLTDQPLDDNVDPLVIREYPSLEGMRAVFEAIRDRRGSVLAVFTHYALRYYNRTGQMERSLQVHDYRRFCTELFWPRVHHTYTIELHRRRLIETVTTWATYFVDAWAPKRRCDKWHANDPLSSLREAHRCD